MQHLWGFFLKQQSPEAISSFFFLQLRVQRFSAHPGGREVDRELEAGLNTAPIDYHSIRFRLGSSACGRDAAGDEKGGVNPKHHQPVLIAEMLPQGEKKKKKGKPEIE